MSLTFALGWLLGACAPVFALPATTVTLAVTSEGSAVTTVSAGTVVTLTATVKAGTTPVTPGQVEFCDATVAHCLDIHLLATAQLTHNGTATYKFRPGGGSHSYKAIFKGTTSYASSTSSTAALTVTGPFPSVTTLTQSSANGGPWTLTATVSGGMSTPGLAAPTGTVSFLDTSNGNAVLATAPLERSSSEFGFSNLSSPLVQAGVVGDFNGDGIPDLALPFDGFVTVLLGNGDGTFTTKGNSTTGSSDPNSMVVGDFNSDGIPDLAVADFFGNISILLGNGDGKFTIKGSPLTESDDRALMTVGDFNGDGIPDLAVVGEYGSNVSVFLGNGDGTFTPATASSPTGGGDEPTYIAVGDFNGDGIADLAVAAANSPTAVSFNWATSISILLGNGDGTFTLNSMPATGMAPTAIAVVDLNGDGIPDLFVVNSASANITVLTGNGDGTFSNNTNGPGIGYGAVTVPGTIAVGDFNGDGIPDVVTTGYSGLWVMRDTNGSISATSFPLNSGSFAVGDFNGDGLPDIAAYNAVLLTQSGWTATATAAGITPASLGTHLVDAAYPGDSNYDPSLPGTVIIDVEKAALTSPSAGNKLDGSATFLWTTGSGVTEYEFELGTTGAGSSNLYNSGPTTELSAIVTGLPMNGGTVFARLSSLIDGTWQSVDYLYGTVAPAVLMSPAPGSHLTGSTVTFRWTSGTGVSQFILSLGTNWPGGINVGNVYDTGYTQATLSGLPTDGVTIYARLWSQINNVWLYKDYTYTAFGTLAPAVLTSPVPASHLTSSNVTFKWSPGSGVTQYRLFLATDWVGGINLYSSGDITANQVTVSGLPTSGVTIYARLWSEIENGWQYQDYTYTASGTLAPAVLTSPAPGSQLTGSNVTFKWTPGSGATQYRLYLATDWVGGANLDSAFDTAATQATFSNLPTNGVTIYARLWSEIENVWQYKDYTYTAF